VDTLPGREPEIHKLFHMARKFEASGLALQVGSPPLLSLRGVTRKVDMRPLSAQDLERLLLPILWADQQQHLDRGEEVTFTYAFDAGHRFRVSVAKTGGCLQLSAHWVGVA
jgi:Tfp pilus assembly pilus retraction ATPase PilT